MVEGHPQLARYVLLPMLALIWSAGACAAAPAPGKKLVCWIEASGRSACGDSIPPEYAHSERKVHDSIGRIVRTIPGELTQEQRADLADAERQAARERRKAEQQAAYDRALLASYSKPEELAALRDERLLTIDTRLRLAEKAGARVEGSLANLRKLIAENKQIPDPRSQAQMTELEKSWKDSIGTVADLRTQRESVCSTFDRDIRRFQELQSGSVKFRSSCPGAETLLPGGGSAEDRQPMLRNPALK